MKRVTNKSLPLLLRGASLLSCGGGLSYTEQLKLTRKKTLVLALKKGIELIPAKDLPDNGWCITISEVGEASAPVMDKSQLPKALELFETRTGKKVRALIPGEIGQEAIVLESAAILNLPIVDADLSGCRAVPRLTDLALVVRGVPFTMSPLVVLRADGRMEFVPQQPSLADDEARVRGCVPIGEVVTLVGAAVRGKIVKHYLDYASYSVALSLGRALTQGRALRTMLPTACLFGPVNGMITRVQEEREDGFSKKRVTLVTRGKQEITIDVENEYMHLHVGGKTYSFPQLVMLFSERKKRGIHSSEIKEGDQVTVMVADAFDFWKGKNV